MDSSLGNGRKSSSGAARAGGPWGSEGPALAQHADSAGPDVEALFPLLLKTGARVARTFPRHRVDGEDLAQDCAYGLLVALRAGARAPRDKKDMGGWAFQFMRHRALQEVETGARRDAARPDGRLGPFVREAGGEAEAPQPGDFRALRAAVAGLLPEAVDVVVLLLSYDQPVAEVARVLSVPVAVVRGRVRHAVALVAEGAGAADMPYIGPLTLEEFLVQGRREGRSVGELAYAARISLAQAKRRLRRPRMALSGESVAR